MNLTANFILVLVALILFLVAAIGVPSGRVNLIALGLFFWLLSTLVARS